MPVLLKGPPLDQYAILTVKTRPAMTSNLDNTWSRFVVIFAQGVFALAELAEYSEAVRQGDMDKNPHFATRVDIRTLSISLGAAGAGLLPAPGLLQYPKDAPYTRIVLQRLLPANVTVALALRPPPPPTAVVVAAAVAGG